MLARKALAGTAGAPKVYVEDVFSTYLYTGTGSNQTITNNIDLSGKGGLVYLKSRSAIRGSALYDTARGATYLVESASTNAATEEPTGLTSFSSTGFAIGTATQINTNGTTYVSWTFRKAKKFFDVVTYTGNGTTQAISHNLGSAPGSVWVKSTSAGGTNWFVWHRSLTSGYYIYLNTTDAQTNANNTITFGNNTTTVDPTSTNFTIGSNGNINDSGQSYVAYLFAHDAGGFGDAGSDSIIKCGSYTGTESNGTVIDLGWEPQWLLIKNADAGANWVLIDNMRGVTTGGVDTYLRPNTTNADDSTSDLFDFHATGFEPRGTLGICNASNRKYIYIAIRKGPMKTPETGTSVFTPTAFSGNDTSGTRSAGLNAFDLLIAKRRGVNSLDWVWLDKLRGLAGNKWLASNATTAESGGDIINTINGQYTQDGINITKTSNYSYLDSSGNTYIWYALKRAPKFFDEICYTGTGSATTITHNLGVAPELMIVKRRETANAWAVYANNDNTDYLVLNTTAATVDDNTYWNDTSPTSSVFSVGTNNATNASGSTYVAYLFASLSGVSKVGSYTGNGSSQTINCGFTAGARFVLIKQTDSAGNWYVFDTARGIVTGNDPLLSLNTADAEDTPARDAIDPDNSGFIVNNDATYFPINVNNATYIYLAIA